MMRCAYRMSPPDMLRHPIVNVPIQLTLCSATTTYDLQIPPPTTRSPALSPSTTIPTPPRFPTTQPTETESPNMGNLFLTDVSMKLAGKTPGNRHRFLQHRQLRHQHRFLHHRQLCHQHRFFHHRQLCNRHHRIL